MKELLKLTEVGFLSSHSTLLDSVSFSLKHNQILGLLGVNGAGKSTTLKICAGILLPSRGSVHCAFSDSYNHIGYLPETPPLLAHWRVSDFLLHVAKLRQVKNPKQAIMRVIELCRLDSVLVKKNYQLSKGNQQRVALATAIIHEPSILILDEPTSGLDPQQIHNFRLLLKRLSSDTGVIFSTHIMQEAEQLCDDVVIIHQGKSTAQIEVHAEQQWIAFEFAHEIDAAQLSSLPGWQRTEGLRHYFSFAEQTDKSEVIQFCIQNQLPLCDIISLTHQLETAFLDNVTSTQSKITND